MGEPRWFANHNLRKNEDEMKRSKKYNEAAAKVIKDHLYTPLEAVTLAKETSTVKYNASVEVALVLGVDPKKADQAIRSTVNLPHEQVRLLAFWFSLTEKKQMQLVQLAQISSVAMI